MHAYPHHYEVQGLTQTEGHVVVRSEGLPVLTTAPPAQFDGPGDQWSPETLLMAAVSACFILTFRAIAAVSKLPWRRLECDAEGIVDRSDGVVRFTELHVRARLVIPAGGDAERAKRLADKAERACLVTNSLAVRPTMTIDVTAEAS